MFFLEVLFDNLQNEIDLNVKSSEGRERLSNNLMRIQAAYNESLVKFVKNRLELQEVFIIIFDSFFYIF